MEVKSPMSGNVWKIIVKENDTVSAGETVAILESMKMEIPVEAEQNGKVSKINVSEGDFIQDGETLLMIE